MAEKHQDIMDLVKRVSNFDDKISSLVTYTMTRFVRLEHFVNTYLQLKLIVEEIRQSK